MKVAVTGADGFLGWHTRCLLKARGVDEVVPIGRSIASPQDLDHAVAGVDVVIHLAGVNRAEERRLRDENLSLAEQITSALDRVSVTPAVVYANSIHSGNGTAFGDGKLAAAEHFASWGMRSGSPVADVHLPNLFGEHGRPHYNSFVATFCHELASGNQTNVTDDREVPLMHVQQAANTLLTMARDRRSGRVDPPGRPMLVTAIVEKLLTFRDLYAQGDIPEVRDPFDLDLFNTYRSFCFPTHYPIYPQRHSDQRGVLFDCLRAHGGESQVFCSSTRPGFTRGEHFHLRKVERFLVLRGKAEISLRRLFDDAVIRFEVVGDRPAIVDMPTMWAHNLTNIGSDELMTLFWAHEILDPDNADTYPERVEPEEAAA